MGQHDLTCNGCRRRFTVQGIYDDHRRDNPACKAASVRPAPATGLSAQGSASSQGPSNFRCEPCGKSFNNQNGLNNHLAYAPQHQTPAARTPFVPNPQSRSFKMGKQNRRFPSPGKTPRESAHVSNQRTPATGANATSWRASPRDNTTVERMPRTRTRETTATTNGGSTNGGWGEPIRQSDHACGRCAKAFRYRIDRYKHMVAEHPEHDPGTKPENDHPSWDTEPSWDNTNDDTVWGAPTTGNDTWATSTDQNGWSRSPANDWKAEPLPAEAASMTKEDKTLKQKPANRSDGIKSSVYSGGALLPDRYAPTLAGAGVSTNDRNSAEGSAVNLEDSVEKGKVADQDGHLRNGDDDVNSALSKMTLAGPTPAIAVSVQELPTNSAAPTYGSEWSKGIGGQANWGPSNERSGWYVDPPSDWMVRPSPAEAAKMAKESKQTSRSRSPSVISTSNPTWKPPSRATSTSSRETLTPKATGHSRLSSRSQAEFATGGDLYRPQSSNSMKGKHRASSRTTDSTRDTPDDGAGRPHDHTQMLIDVDEEEPRDTMLKSQTLPPQEPPREKIDGLANGMRDSAKGRHSLSFHDDQEYKKQKQAHVATPSRDEITHNDEDSMRGGAGVNQEKGQHQQPEQQHDEPPMRGGFERKYYDLRALQERPLRDGHGSRYTRLLPGSSTSEDYLPQFDRATGQSDDRARAERLNMQYRNRNAPSLSPPPRQQQIRTNGVHTVHHRPDHRVEQNTDFLARLVNDLGDLRKEMETGLASVRSDVSESRRRDYDEAYRKGRRDAMRDIMDDYHRMTPRDFQRRYAQV